MTLEEAIRHAEEKAKCGGRCGEDHAQLAEWLKELQERRTAELEKRTEERTETHACDLIDRQTVIAEFSCCELTPDGWIDANYVIEFLENLPSAQPERKTGRWVEIASDDHTYKCSVCGRLLVNITDGKNNVAKNYPYCHCGAYMGGEQDEAD